MLRARFEEARGALMVTLLVRRLDAEAAVELRRLVAGRARGRALLVVSLAHVDHVDCSGLAGLVSLLKQMAPGGELRLASAPPSVRQLLVATHLDQVFPTFDDASRALPP